MITVEGLLEKFIYCKSSGKLFYRIKQGNRSEGEEAGSKTEKGYLRVYIRPKYYRIHRLIWFIETGAWPTHEIDHIDGDKTNNRISNLRDVPAQINQQNRKSAKGYYKSGKKWAVDLYFMGEKVRVGVFDTPEEARQAYISAKEQHYEGYVPPDTMRV